MPDDALDGALGVTGNEPDLTQHGTTADLVRRANAVGFPTIALYVDWLENCTRGFMLHTYGRTEFRQDRFIAKY